MPMLDPRLLDLIETLTATGLDWLAFELLEGVRAGKTVIEHEEVLAAARRAIAANDQPKPRGEPPTQMTEPDPIAGDDQIVWAAAYVAERLDTSLAQLNAAIDTLDTIVGDGAKADDIALAKPPLGPVVVLTDGDAPRKAVREDAIAARDAIPTLRASLDAWVQQVVGSPLQ